MTMSQLHNVTLLTHILTGSLVILLGVILLLRPKGDTRHRKLGRVALNLGRLSIAAALTGALVFRGKPDLLGVSLLVAYHLWSGVRSLRLKDNGRRLADFLPAFAIFCCGAGIFVLYLLGAKFFWEPARIYAAAGGLMFYGGWDLLRTLLPAVWRRYLNPAEHAFKMTSIIGAMISVAGATVLPPYALSVVLLGTAVFAIFGGFLAVRAAMRA
jgi:uncharacterized membrane protein